MFKIDTAPKFWLLVRPAVPGAGPDDHSFRLLMSVPGATSSLRGSAAITTAATPEEALAAEIADIAGLVTDWADIVDDAGQPVPFSAESLAKLLDLTLIRAAIYRDFGRAFREAAEKN